MRVFHFCTKEFYNDLQERKEIIADDRDFDISEPAGYVKNYVFKVMKLNNGNGMFFTWSNPEYKGTIEYNSNRDYMLLELEVDETGNLKVESVFDIAKRKAAMNQYNVNIFDTSNMTIAGLRTFNNQLKNNISKSPYISAEQAVKLYEKLDLTLSAYLASKKEVKS